MALLSPLPPRVRELLRIEGGAIHPGLLLDKYAESWDPGAPPGKLSERIQRPTVARVRDASQGTPAGLDWKGLWDRRNRFLESIASGASGQRWARPTATTLTLHLARASALENAGLCLHPIYGFAYLPGTGLKGLARAHAETVWIASLPREKQAEGWRQIESVFGWAPGSDLVAPGQAKPWKPRGACPEHGTEDAASAGTIVFHDAWPTDWPRLIMDIVNNHHPTYYQGKNPPGDWDSPKPVYFLAVPAGQAFAFAISKRRDDVSGDDLAKARDWLDGGLTLLGCGAKTAAGYGRFHTDDGASRSHRDHPRLAEFPASLRLVTPAYFAGASQDRSDCELRSASLRGMLRWWWRTLHVGFVDLPALRRLEALLWGDTQQGGIIQTIVTGAPNPGRLVYRGYLNYGMADNDRLVCLEDTQWQFRLVARSNPLNKGVPTPRQALEQALAALWLLSSFGGLGSKGRKGYGSLEVESGDLDSSLERCEGIAREFRAWAKTRPNTIPPPSTDESLRPAWAVSPCLRLRIGPFEWEAGSKDPRSVLEAIDSAYRAAAMSLDRAERLALGLPRKGQPRADLERHASPVHLHVARGASGNLIIRAIAFPSSRLDVPRGRSCRDILADFSGRLDGEIRSQIEGLKSRAPSRVPGPSSRSTDRRDPRAIRQPASAPGMPRVGGRVQATLLPERTKKGGWRARHEPSGFSGPVQDSGKIPPEKQPGDVVTLLVTSINEFKKEMSFKAE